jgi:formate dehydrogenase assembly factor FdhD
MGEVDSGSEMFEECRDCHRETPHSVSVELRVESEKQENAVYSREPYRVSTCRVCGTESVIRLNNA